MSTTPSSFLNMVLTLGVVTILSAFSLGFVYEWTKEPIAAAREAKQLKAINSVLGTYDNEPLADRFLLPGLPGNDSLEVYPGFKAGEATGVAIKTYSEKGYSGRVVLMVGFLPDGTIQHVEVLDHRETPGLGSKMSSPSFSGQFAGKNPETFSLKVRKDGGQVDAISGATISSRAFGEAVELAFESFKQKEK